MLRYQISRNYSTRCSGMAYPGIQHTLPLKNRISVLLYNALQYPYTMWPHLTYSMNTHEYNENDWHLVHILQYTPCIYKIGHSPYHKTVCRNEL